MCVGGLLSLVVPGAGESVREGVLDPLRPDVFVAGTLNASRAEVAARPRPWRRRVRRAFHAIRALAPFVDAAIQPQPSGDELLAALQAHNNTSACCRFQECLLPQPCPTKGTHVGAPPQPNPSPLGQVPRQLTG